MGVTLGVCNCEGLWLCDCVFVGETDSLALKLGVWLWVREGETDTELVPDSVSERVPEALCVCEGLCDIVEVRLGVTEGVWDNDGDWLRLRD